VTGLLVTGANGFLGSALLQRLQAEQRPVLGAARQPADNPVRIQVDSLGPTTNWRIALEGRNVVIHTAARVHVMKETSADPLEEFRRVNVHGTLNLARQAALAGVRRLVFISSIKVNGEGTPLGVPYTAEDAPAPMDAYGISKLEAEEGLQQVGEETGLEVVVIRPPLVYGPGVKGNFLSMMRWLRRGVPLPLGAIRNKRSLVALDNLVDLILRCAEHPAAANQTFLAGDGEDLSTTELLHRLGAALERPARLVPVPQSVLESALGLLGRRDLARRLCGSLQVDIGKAGSLLGWTPPVSVDEGLAATARHYLEQQA
jgi:nucleoside-diphosphate-sugar epimerase